MKNILMLFLIFTTTAMANEQELKCKYLHDDGEDQFIHEFNLSVSVPSDERSFRMHGYKVKIEETSFQLEVFSRDQKKIVSQSLNNAWNKNRDPKKIEANFKFEKSKISVSCR
jgi:hypothetical protein